MEGIKDISLIFCICSVVFGVVLVLVPAGRYEKSIKTVVGLLMLAIIFSIAGNNFNFDFEFSVNPDTELATENSLSELSERQVLDLTENVLKQQISQLLDSKGIKDYKIKITMDNSGTNGISISKAEIYLKNADKSVSELIYQNFGIKCEILQQSNSKVQ
ncbi:MAG: stage III sporulation protein AF [bacterium]|nr:stage III sporulation protein AF [bacterium]